MKSRRRFGFRSGVRHERRGPRGRYIEVAITVGIYALNKLGLAGVSYMLALLEFTLVATLLISIATFRLVEKPGIQLGTRVANRLARSPARKDYPNDLNSAEN